MYARETPIKLSVATIQFIVCVRSFIRLLSYAINLFLVVELPILFDNFINLKK